MKIDNIKIQRFTKFIKNEINEINLILKDKKVINTFLAFKYLLYIPLSIILASIILIIILGFTFLKGLWSSFQKDTRAHNTRNKNNGNKNISKAKQFQNKRNRNN